MSTTMTEDPSSSTGTASRPAATPGFLARLVARLRGREPTLRESIEDVIEEHREGLASLTREERVMLRNIVDLREREIEDVMVPRADIIALGIDTPFNQ
ncbi:MAG: magnesium/cobalt efflux protein, partial [Alphaproteobacteria bacterium]|nr:magnesium/cobalt efflux protein [Alphaproteobacteria bacterium]